MKENCYSKSESLTYRKPMAKYYSRDRCVITHVIIPGKILCQLASFARQHEIEIALRKIGRVETDHLYSSFDKFFRDAKTQSNGLTEQRRSST